MNQIESYDEKYKNGKIYKIVSGLTDKIYIGSTVHPLRDRFCRHNYNYKCYLDGTQNAYMSSFDIIKLGDAMIASIENFPCNSKQELLYRERYWIEFNMHIVSNKYIPITSIDEKRQNQIDYCQQNREARNIRSNEHYLANKERILTRRKEIITCDICNCAMTRASISLHNKSKKHIANQSNQKQKFLNAI